jgi:hypothetical protein
LRIERENSSLSCLQVVVANLVASLFDHDGVYESEIEHDHQVHFLHAEPPRTLATITAADVMTREPVCLPAVARVSHVLAALRDTAHHGFPVVKADTATSSHGGYVGCGELAGVALRSQLLVLLEELCAPPWPHSEHCSYLLREYVMGCGVYITINSMQRCLLRFAVRAPDTGTQRVRALLFDASNSLCACSAFCDRDGEALNARLQSRRARYRLERRMRLFYRRRYKHGRYASTQAPSVVWLHQALARHEGVPVQEPALPEGRAGNVAELEGLLQAPGSVDNLFVDLRHAPALLGDAWILRMLVC